MVVVSCLLTPFFVTLVGDDSRCSTNYMSVMVLICAESMMQGHVDRCRYDGARSYMWIGVGMMVRGHTCG